MATRYRSELHAIMKHLWKIKSSLKDLAISTTRPSDDPWYDCAEHWGQLGDGLSWVLLQAERQDFLLRVSLYDNAIQNIETPKPGPATQPDESATEPSPKVQQAIDFIRQKGKVKGLLIANHIQVSYPRFRSHYVPLLKACGVENKGDGYYLPKA